MTEQSKPAGVRIHVPNKGVADTIWRLLIGQELISRAELHVDGVGYLYEAIRTDDGRWTTRREAP